MYIKENYVFNYVFIIKNVKFINIFNNKIYDTENIIVVIKKILIYIKIYVY